MDYPKNIPPAPCKGGVWRVTTRPAPSRNGHYLEDARGAVGWRDEGAVDPGDFFTITHGSGHFCHIGYCTLLTQIRFYISYSKVPANSTLSHPHTNPNLMNTVILSQGMQQRLWLSLNWKEGTQATNWTMGHVQGRTYIPFATISIWGCI